MPAEHPPRRTCRVEDFASINSLPPGSKRNRRDHASRFVFVALKFHECCVECVFPPLAHMHWFEGESGSSRDLQGRSVRPYLKGLCHLWTVLGSLRVRWVHDQTPTQHRPFVPTPRSVVRR
jgi:hypothetical protein